MAVDLASSKVLSLTTRNARRSTRIFQVVPVTISSRGEAGNPFMESTSTLALNCHGCLYPSQHKYDPGSWVTLEVPTQVDEKSHPVRAQVRYVGLSRNPGEPYQVGIELQTPANVWGIQLPPEDWLRFPGAMSAATAPVLPLHSYPPAVTARKMPVLASPSGPLSSASISISHPNQPPAASPDSDKPLRVAPDDVKRAFEAKLQQAAEKAVSLALTSQLNAAISQAARTIETLSQAAAHDLQQQCLSYEERLVASARGKLEASLSEAQETAQQLEKSSSEVHFILAEALDFLQETARERGVNFSAGLRKIADQAAVEFGHKTARFSERHLAHASEHLQGTAGEAMARLQERAAEARAQLDKLNSLATDTRTECEARCRASQDELARSSAQAIQQFRQRMEAMWDTSIVAAMSAVNEHSRSLLDSLSKERGRQLRDVRQDGLVSPHTTPDKNRRGLPSDSNPTK